MKLFGFFLEMESKVLRLGTFESLTTSQEDPRTLMKHVIKYHSLVPRDFHHHVSKGNSLTSKANF